MGGTGVSKSQVSRLCEEIDARVKVFLDRPLEGGSPYVWLDATYVKVRRNHRIVSVAAIVAIGVNADGRREVLGMDIGLSAAETFWTGFLRKLRRRGLRGVTLVISDALEGIKAAVAKLMNATWQCCRVHKMRNALAHAGKSGRRVVSPRSWRPLRPWSAPRPPRFSAQGRRSAQAETAQARRLRGRVRLHELSGRSLVEDPLDG
jgi:transposase-like protein